MIIGILDGQIGDSHIICFHQNAEMSTHHAAKIEDHVSPVACCAAQANPGIDNVDIILHVVRARLDEKCSAWRGVIRLIAQRGFVADGNDRPGSGRQRGAMIGC